MNAEIKKKWVEALRSGKYKQGKTHLARKYVETQDGDPTVKYCCMGVLASVQGISDEYMICSVENVNCNPFTKDEKLKSLGVGIADVDQGRLISMNDSQGKTFSEIADWIEANL